MIHDLWADRIYVEDNLCPAPMFFNLRNFVCQEFAQQKSHILKWSDHAPVTVGWFRQFLLAAFSGYSHRLGLDFSEYQIGDLAAARTECYQPGQMPQLASHPHVDICMGQFAVFFYLEGDEGTPTQPTGGDLAVYKSLHLIDYPQNCTMVKFRTNRLVILPSDLVHQVTPYFGETPRIALVADIRREQADMENADVRWI